MKSESINPDSTDASHCVNLALIDLECTCNDDDIFGPHEIIEIGAVVGKLSLESFEIFNELQIYVRPTINPTLTEFCTDLTGITQDTVDSSTTLDNALPVFEVWLQKNSVQAWASWGKFDASQFRRECDLKTYINRMAEIQHVNVKQFFARKYGHRVGLSRALELCGLAFAGRQHSGIDDAKNIGRLLSEKAKLREALFKRITTNRDSHHP